MLACTSFLVGSLLPARVAVSYTEALTLLQIDVTSVVLGLHHDNHFFPNWDGDSGLV